MAQRITGRTWISTQRAAVIVALGFLLAGCGGSGDAASTATGSGNAPTDSDLRGDRGRLAVSTSELAFEEIPVAARGSRAVTIMNVGSANMTERKITHYQRPDRIGRRRDGGRIAAL